MQLVNPIFASDLRSTDIQQAAADEHQSFRGVLGTLRQWLRVKSDALWRRVAARPRALAIAVVSAAAALTAAPAHAGGYGSVWKSSATCSTITIDWSDPSGNIKYASSPPSFQVCYKPVGQIFPLFACNASSVVTTNKPFTLTGLAPKQNYHINVYAYTFKKNWFGVWKNPEYRLVGKINIPTECGTGSLTIPSSNNTSITASQSWSNPSEFDLIRIGYKRKWSFFPIKAACKNRANPSTIWGNPNDDRGWFDFSPPTANNTNVFAALKMCTSYKFVAYGFAPGQNTGILIGSASAQTGGGCKKAFEFSTPLTDTAVPIAEDHEEILVDYAQQLDELYAALGATPLEAAAVFEPALLEQAAFLTESDDEDMSLTYNVLHWLIDDQWDAFEAWQNGDPTLAGAGMSLPSYVEMVDPDLYAALLDESWNPPAGILGDINLDGHVDGADLGLLLGAFGTSDAAADLNGDGAVDGADLGLLLAAWG